MKKTLIILAVLAFAGAVSAQVNPARPMLTGHGNAITAAGRVIITNQTAGKAKDAIKLDKFVVTGSLLVDAARPMVTGRGNVTAVPGRVILTNQTAAKTDDTVKLDKFVVTGSLLPH